MGVRGEEPTVLPARGERLRHRVRHLHHPHGVRRHHVHNHHGGIRRCAQRKHVSSQICEFVEI